MTMAVNHYGHFYLTYLIFPLLLNSASARIINVSSTVHFRYSDSPADDLDASQKWGSFSSYCKSKLANVIFTVGLAQKLVNNPKIKTASLHPGLVDS
jgi:retinol dehydrogenase-12